MSAPNVVKPNETSLKLMSGVLRNMNPTSNGRITPPRRKSTAAEGRNIWFPTPSALTPSSESTSAIPDVSTRTAETSIPPAK